MIFLLWLISILLLKRRSICPTAAPVQMHPPPIVWHCGVMAKDFPPARLGEQAEIASQCLTALWLWSVSSQCSQGDMLQYWSQIVTTLVINLVISPLGMALSSKGTGSIF
eukprot:scpid13017/ scgid13084/ 